MNLQGIVARSGQAFKYILDPNTDLMSPRRAAELGEVQKQLAEAGRKLTESEKNAREKDALIARLRDELAAKSELLQAATAQNSRDAQKRNTRKKTSARARTGATSAKSATPRKKRSVRKPKPSACEDPAKKTAAKGRRPRQSKRTEGESKS